MEKGFFQYEDLTHNMRCWHAIPNAWWNTCLCHQYWKIIPNHRKVNPTRSLTNMQSSTAWVATARLHQLPHILFLFRHCSWEMTTANSFGAWLSDCSYWSTASWECSTRRTTKTLLITRRSAQLGHVTYVMKDIVYVYITSLNAPNYMESGG